MLRDEIKKIYRLGIEKYCTDQIYDWSHDLAKLTLANEGKPNVEPSRGYMIILIIDRFEKELIDILEQKEDEYGTSIKTVTLSESQMQHIFEIAKKANGTSSTLGGGAAGAGLGFLFGGFIGAAIGGIIGAVAGNSYNNKNRQKFNEVLKECIYDYTEYLYQNNYNYRDSYDDQKTMANNNMNAYFDDDSKYLNEK